MRVSVVGAGIMGLATAWALCRQGHRVTVFEQGPVPNPLGSSVDQHRLIRYPYGAEDGYVRMVGEAYGAWDVLWSDLGERLQVETGTLAFDIGGDAWTAQCEASLARCAVPFDTLSPEAMAARFPHLDPRGLVRALYAPSGGILLAERIVAALAGWLARHGAVVRAHARVAAVEPETAELSLADGERVRADALVVAAGPWGPRLVPVLGRRVTPSRQVVSYLEPPERWRAAWAASPMILSIGPEAGFYAVPPAAGTGLKIGDHRFSLTGDPDLDREASPAEAAAIVEQCRSRFRDFDAYRLARAKTCFYDVEPEERFVIEPLAARAWVLGGFSGHGFKFGALIGMRLAAGLAGELDPAGLGRWAAGKAA